MSILLLTRQKNWLSTPQKGKQVSFQLHNKSDNNSQTTTMAKSRNNSDNRDSSSSDKKKKVKKSSGIQPFLFTPEEWPKDAAEQTIETTEGRNRL